MLGKTIARYKILELLGKGGMGEVYRAQDTRLGREVALKVLPPEAAQDEAVRSRLEQEARAVAALHHPNIVTLFSVEEDEGHLFLTMELVRGPTLAEVARAGLETGRLLGLAVPLTEAIGAAHRMGIVHRDLKPSNIMLDEAGRIKVLDFGLAKHVGLSGPTDETALTEAMTTEGMIVGTFAYVSPEQAQGRPVDARSDVFSLGIILYQMATGRRPFEGDNPISVLSAIIKDPPASEPTLHPRLARIIERCLQKDSHLRYASATELHHDLAELKQEFDSGTETPAVQTRSFPVRWLFLPVALLLGFLGWRMWTPGSSPPEAGMDTAMTQVIVVFPFENLGESEDAYFAEGMTDEIVSRLTSVPGLGVISRTTAIQYVRQGKTLDQVGKDLGVSFILDGTIRWDRRDGANRVRVTPQLVRVADGMNAWSASYDRNLDDVFAIQSEIATQVVTSIDARLTSQIRPELQRTKNLEAYDYFLQAKDLAQWGIGPSQSKLDRAAALLEKAVALDPEFALALAHLSMVHSSMSFLQFDDTPERLHLAEQTADEALRLQPNLAEAHLAKGLYLYRSIRDYSGALEELRAARQLEPGNGEILSWIGTIRKRQGQFQEALEILHQAIRLDPRNPTTLGEIAVVYREIHEFPSAMQWADRLIEVDPTLQNRLFRARTYYYWKGDTAPWRAVLESAESVGCIHWVPLLKLERRFDVALTCLDSLHADSTNAKILAWKWLTLAELLYLNGEPAESRAAASQAAAVLERLVVPHDRSFGNNLALAYAFQGRRDEAVEQVQRSRTRIWGALEGAEITEIAAHVYAVLGDTSSAVSLLEELLSKHSGLTLPVLELDPAWDPVRGSPSFQALLERQRSRAASPG